MEGIKERGGILQEVEVLDKDIVVAPQTGEYGELLVSPERAKAQLRQMHAVVREVMVEGEHYGVIPGTSKLTLLKPGAELLNNMYGFLLDSVEIVERTEQWDVPVTETSFPLFRYITRCTLKDRNGITVSTGVGECNSYESKYRWRVANRRCPRCGKETIIKGKVEFGGGWVCFKSKGGCGARFRDGDEAIESQRAGRVPNENIYDQVNTLLKMPKKRSYIDACLSATRTSGIFTQDMEDLSSGASAQQDPNAASQPSGSTAAGTPAQGGAGQNGGQNGQHQGAENAGQFVMPMGPNKGRRLSEIDRETLRKASAWCKARQKFLDVAERIDAYLGSLTPDGGDTSAVA